jgi:hypothetical protein
LNISFSRFSTAILALSVLAGVGVMAQTELTPVASADGFGRTQVTFTKYITTFPSMAGIVGGDVGDGEFAGTVLNVEPLAGGKILRLTAEYHLNGGLHSSTAHLTVMQFDNKFAVINGAVTDGWRVGAGVYGIYKVISCSEAPDGTCFQGTLYFAGGAQ